MDDREYCYDCAVENCDGQIKDCPLLIERRKQECEEEAQSGERSQQA